MTRKSFSNKKHTLIWTNAPLYQFSIYLFTVTFCRHVRMYVCIMHLYIYIYISCISLHFFILVFKYKSMKFLLFI